MSLLSPIFYKSDDVVDIARLLLGKVVVTNIGNAITSGMIVETEAYRAPDDRACHAHKNRHTIRNKSMFGNGGIAYIYLCYGVHHMLNVVTSTKGNAHAVLIRAIEPIDGIAHMVNRRGQEKLSLATVNGPGKLCVALGIDKSLDGRSLMDKDELWIEERGLTIDATQIISGPRVGLSKLTGADAHRLWRFSIEGNKWVSNPKVVSYPQEWRML